jgi:hypothetical protein
MERASINWWESTLFAKYGILVPPHATVYPRFGISAGGLCVAPVPRGRALVEEIDRRRSALPPRKRNKAKHARDSVYWPNHFQRKRTAVLGCQLQPPHLRNIEARLSFWSVPGRGIYDAVREAEREAFM